jgi:hypothetical protein
LAVEIRNTLSVRTPAYRRLADLAIDTTAMDREACVDRIEAFLQDKYTEQNGTIE